MKFYIELYLDHNIGDDLFLACLLDDFPNCEFYLGVPKDFGDLNIHFNRYNNLNYVDVATIMNVNDLKHMDGYILIGGSIFIDNDNKMFKFWLNRLLISLYMKYMNKSYFVMGSNIGPLNTKLGSFLIKHHLKSVSSICVRDSQSYDILKQWKVPSTFSLGSDIVFNYNVENLNLDEVKNTLGISVVNTNNYSSDNKNEYINKLADIINLIHVQGWVVRLFAFDGGKENDEKIIDKIVHLVNNKKLVEIVTYNKGLSLNNFLESFLQCEFVICSRFHAMILALRNNKKMFTISYSNKINNVLSDVGYNYYFVDYSKINELNISHLVFEVVLKRINAQFKLNDEYVMTSNQHFKQLHNLIEKNNSHHA
jgi:colanic acid/amylovoran biosynthesis protein